MAATARGECKSNDAGPRGIMMRQWLCFSRNCLLTSAIFELVIAVEKNIADFRKPSEQIPTSFRQFARKDKSGDLRDETLLPTTEWIDNEDDQIAF